MTRSNMRLWALTGLLFVFIACAKAEGGGPIGEGDGDGDGAKSGSGGTVLSSTGGVVISSSGGGPAGSGGVTVSPAGGALSLGGEMNLGGASTGGVTNFDGQCAGLGGLASVTAMGDKRVYTCPKVQSNCVTEALNVPALFECVSTHVPNCTGQTPDGATSWEFLGLCSETGLGGATN